jgi:hypothetical protein
MAIKSKPVYPTPSGNEVLPQDTSQEPLGIESQPKGDKHPASLTKKELIPLLFYLSLVAIVEIVGIVDLCLHTWIRYCRTRFGLTSAYSKYDDETLSVLIDLCDDDTSDGPCGDLCSNLKYLRDAGIEMQVLGAFAIVFTAASAVLIILQLFFSKQLIPKIAKSLLPIGMGLWILGTIICIALYVRVIVDAPDEASPKGGMGLAIANAVLHVVCCVLGYSAVRTLIARWG